MIICNCAAVGHAAICKAVDQDGLRTVKQLQTTLHVADQCKKCAVAAKAIIDLTLEIKAANKAAGIDKPVQLEINIMLKAISKAEDAKRHSDSLSQTRKLRAPRKRKSRSVKKAAE